MNYHAVFQVAAALLEGRVLQIHEVSAGNGLVVDWRTVRCGETLVADADAFDAALVFVSTVGPATALEAVRRELGEAA